MTGGRSPDRAETEFEARVKSIWEKTGRNENE